MKLTEENLKFLKDNLTPKDLIDLVALKSRMNNRKKKIGAVNEAEDVDSTEILDLEGFKYFIENYLSDEEIEKFNSIFSKFINNDSSYYANIVYNKFMKFMTNIDKQLISDAQ